LDNEKGIEIRDLSYAYGSKLALEDITVTVRKSRFTALLGPNGAGKSTLVALLSGLFLPKAGSIEVCGHNMAVQPRLALSRMGIVFQAQTLDLDLSVQQNMGYFASLHGLHGRAVRARIDACLDRMDLASRRTDRVRELNSGHRRRLEIARALLHQPRVMLLDEATVGLDVPSRTGIVEHVHRLCTEQGLAVLWASHLVDEVWADDDLIVLHEGRVRAAGPVTDVVSECCAGGVLDAFNRLTAGSSNADSPARGEAV